MWAQRLPLPVRDASRVQFLCETTDWLMSMAKCKSSTNFSFEAFFYHKKYFSEEISLDLWSRNPFYRFWFQLDLQLTHSGVQTQLRTWKPMGTSVKWAQSGSWRGSRLPQSPWHGHQRRPPLKHGDGLLTLWVESLVQQRNSEQTQRTPYPWLWHAVPGNTMACVAPGDRECSSPLLLEPHWETPRMKQRGDCCSTRICLTPQEGAQWLERRNRDKRPSMFTQLYIPGG